MSYEVLCIAGAALAAAYTIFSLLLHRYLQNSKGTAVQLMLGTGEQKDDVTHHVLLVVAHPDDEAMFFAPLVRSLTSCVQGVKVHLLCLTTGNYYGLGATRRTELQASAAILGIQHTYIVDQPDMQDSNESWDLDKVANVIEYYVRHTKAKAVVTFDEGGVSGHVNHSSACHALRNMVLNSHNMQDVAAYTLETTNMFRKYVWLLDLPLSWISCRDPLFVSSWHDVAVAQEAMRSHASQYVWFRRIYVRLSRYMIINTLKPMCQVNSHRNLASTKKIS